jgi:hypothetical protein
MSSILYSEHPNRFFVFDNIFLHAKFITVLIKPLDLIMIYTDNYKSTKFIFMKQKSFILYFLLFASFAVIVQSCKKETGPTGATGPVGPTLTGTASGFASLYDEYGSKLFTNLSNTKVYIIGASDTVYTDTTGKFNFTNLKTGTYNLTFSKSGFGSVNKNVNFIGDSTFLSDTRLSAVPTFTVVSPLNVTISGTTATITGNISAVPSYTAQVVVYVGSSVPTPTSYLLSSVVNVSTTGTAFTAKFSTDQLSSAGFVSGQTINLSAYTISTTSSSSSYENMTSGQTIYTAFNPTSATTTALMP